MTSLLTAAYNAVSQNEVGGRTNLANSVFPPSGNAQNIKAIKFKKILVTYIVIMFSVFFANNVADAEPCRMVGCGIGYIFLPDLSDDNSKPKYFFGNHKCIPPKDSRTFVSSGLPAVNDIVTIKAGVKYLLNEQRIEEKVDAFQPPYVDQSKGVNGCRVEWSQLEEGNTLEAGSKVRILGYRTFVGHHVANWPVTVTDPHPKTLTFPQQLLFALVISQ